MLAALCLGMALASPLLLDPELDVHWENFKQVHNKRYPDGNENMRRFIWEQHLRYIRQHNLEADLGQHSFTMGINEYSDLTDQEYRTYMTGLSTRNVTSTGVLFLDPGNVAMPEKMDWREKGYVTPVKNQAQCGSCWAFSATGSLEGQHFRKYNKLVSLSEQNLVDCSQAEGNHGCHGGNMDAAFEYIKKNDGVDTEESYPYTAKDGECRFKKADVGATDRGFVNIPRDSEDHLLRAAATVGPISVAIDASQMTFRMYKQGVYVDEKCSSTHLDHGVLVVGFGSEDGREYWLVKNSWGESWGDKGYIRMARNHNNMCGIATQASYPIV